MAVKTIPAKKAPETSPPIDDSDDDAVFADPTEDCPSPFKVSDDLNCELVIPRAARAAGDNAIASVKTPLEMPAEMAASTRDARFVTDVPAVGDNKVLLKTADTCTPMSITSPPAARPRLPTTPPVS